MEHKSGFILLSAPFSKKLGVNEVGSNVMQLQAKTERVDNVYLSEFHDYAACVEENETKPPRKKACLTHLSEDEKNLRRKMKNRESAQSARDRKKNYLESLEKRVQDLEAEKVTLQQAKQFVDQNCQKLEKENEQLKRELQVAKCDASKTIKQETKSDSYHWEKVCRQLMVEKEHLNMRVKELEERINLGVVLDAGSNGEQLEHFYPIESEVEVKTCEESSESAALPVSPQQNRFLQALITMTSMLLLSAKFPVASDESTTLLEHALRATIANPIPYQDIPIKVDVGNVVPHLKDPMVVKRQVKQPP